MRPQTALLIAYLRQNGSGTGLDFLKHLGILSYTRRIFEAKQYLQPNEMIESRIIRTETGKHIALYELFRVPI